jgi:hypothetical protein
MARSRADKLEAAQALTLPRNLIVVSRVGFTTATVHRFCSPFSFMARSMANKLIAARHHNRTAQEREKEKNREKNPHIPYYGNPHSLL